MGIDWGTAVITLGAVAATWLLSRMDKRADQSFQTAVAIGEMNQKIAALEDKQTEHSDALKSLALLPGEVTHMRESLDRVLTQISDIVSASLKFAPAVIAAPHAVPAAAPVSRAPTARKRR